MELYYGALALIFSESFSDVKLAKTCCVVGLSPVGILREVNLTAEKKQYAIPCADRPRGWDISLLACLQPASSVCVVPHTTLAPDLKDSTVEYAHKIERR